MANTTLQLRKSGETGNVPPSLAYGELALNYADGKLFYKAANGTITYIQSGGGGSGSSSNSFATINVNSSLILATSPTDTLSFVAGNNVTISACTISKTITINSTGGGGGTLDQFARDTANSASSNTIIIQGVDTTQNTRLGSIETINTNQNTSISIIQGVDLTQNTNITVADSKAQAAFDKANTAPKTTTSNTAPSSPTIGDMWYDTDTDVLLRYTNDGTSNNWIDITGPIIRSTYIRPTYLISANAS
jgi:hypothetical protein